MIELMKRLMLESCCGNVAAVQVWVQFRVSRTSAAHSQCCWRRCWCVAPENSRPWYQVHV